MSPSSLFVPSCPSPSFEKARDVLMQLLALAHGALVSRFLHNLDDELAYALECDGFRILQDIRGLEPDDQEHIQRIGRYMLPWLRCYQERQAPPDGVRLYMEARFPGLSRLLQIALESIHRDALDVT